MAEGRSNVGIAKDLYLSPRTVEAHVTSVFGKLGLGQTETDNNRIRPSWRISASPVTRRARSDDIVAAQRHTEHGHC